MRFHFYVSVLCYLAVPVFLVLAYRAWAKRTPEALSNWRSKLGLTSMLVTSADWCCVILFIIAAKSDFRWFSSVDENWLTYLALAPALAAFLALALEGRARIWAIAAGLSMTFWWTTTWVE
jgi:hypothetical protein